MESDSEGSDAGNGNGMGARWGDQAEDDDFGMVGLSCIALCIMLACVGLAPTQAQCTLSHSLTL